MAILTLVLVLLPPALVAGEPDPGKPATRGARDGKLATDAPADDAGPAATPRPLARARAAAGQPDPTERGTNGTSWGRTTLALAGVIGLIVLLGWGYRAVSQSGRLGLTPRSRQAGLIEVLARTAVAGRQTLCLVRVGPRLILLGVSPERLAALDVIQDAELVAGLAGEAGRRRSDSSTAEFARCLEHEAQAYHAPQAAAGAAAVDDAQVLGVKRRLAGALERLRASQCA